MNVLCGLSGLTTRHKNEEVTTMTAKETIIKAMQNAGYDTITACEHARDIITEFIQSGKQQCSYACGDELITMARV